MLPMNSKQNISLSCPVPVEGSSEILLAHGGGGALMHKLIENVFYKAFNNPYLLASHDGAVLPFGDTRLALTTDSYVVSPLFFPGGDIGTLAINGTINDLAMCGARPLYLSAAFILEEGLDTDVLQRVVTSMAQAAKEVGTMMVTGDTKVVDKGKGDGLFITATGVGIIEHSLTISPAQVTPGDVILLSGDIGRHGITIMGEREGFSFESSPDGSPLKSDCAPLWPAIQGLLEKGVDVHCLRDLTRGGLATALVEIARTRGIFIAIDESAIPVRDDVRGACEILGLDPLYVANEGCFVAFINATDAKRALADVKQFHPDARCIGEVGEAPRGRVSLKSKFGTRRVIDMLSGEQLPRIC